jgi:hypothetical protein
LNNSAIGKCQKWHFLTHFTYTLWIDVPIYSLFSTALTNNQVIREIDVKKYKHEKTPMKSM